MDVGLPNYIETKDIKWAPVFRTKSIKTKPKFSFECEFSE
jgi:hypothetical protein